MSAEDAAPVWEQMWVPVEEYDRIRALLLNIILADDDEFDGPGGAIDHARVHIDDRTHSDGQDRTDRPHTTP